MICTDGEPEAQAREFPRLRFGLTQRYLLMFAKCSSASIRACVPLRP